MAYDLLTRKTTSANYALPAHDDGPILSGSAKLACAVGLAVLLSQIARRTAERTSARLHAYEPGLDETQESPAISDRDLVYGKDR
jgi:hypothetical protein